MMMKPHFFLIRLGPWILLTVFALICYISQREKSVTVDEFNHFASGIYNLITLDLRMDRESPPLIKCFLALTAIITKPDINIKMFRQNPNAWTFGYDFMYRNHEKYRQIFRYGRCAMILLGCLGGFLLYQFANEIYGYKGALMALFLYVFNPNIIAHSRLTTIDVGASCAIFLSIYCFWRFLKRGDGKSAFLAGGSLGLAELSKFTALILYPIFMIIILISILINVFINHKLTLKHNMNLMFKRIIYFIFIILISLFVINLGYIFSGSFTPLKEYIFLSGTLNQLSAVCWKEVPIPLPYDYLTGFDSQLALAAGNNPFYIGYLMGEHSLNGWWYYYFIAFFVKNPVALLAIFMLTIFAWSRMKENGIDFETCLCIWVPIVVFFLYFSFFTNFPIGIRFLLPVFPVFFLAAGYLAHHSSNKGKLANVFIGIMLIAYLISSISVFPHYLSYFNTVSGGPQNGHRWLIDSNLDWGQDLPGLKKYMELKGIKKIKLGYFGRVDPRIYGIDYTLAKKEVEKGIYAISVNFLVGRPYYLLQEDSKALKYVDLDYFKSYRSLQPVDVIGHTIHIFCINGNKF